MARLVGLPALYSDLVQRINGRPEGWRVGQYVWNTYGERGIDGEGWPQLFYADDAKALDIIERYYKD